jgi:hypothetical protein
MAGYGAMPFGKRTLQGNRATGSLTAKRADRLPPYNSPLLSALRFPDGNQGITEASRMRRRFP